MCVVSNIGDYGRQTIPPRYPWVYPHIQPWVDPESPWNPGKTIGWPGHNQPTTEQFDALKQEVEALKKLLQAGKEYDETTGQAECETADKVAVLRKIAELVGVDLEDVLNSEEE